MNKKKTINQSYTTTNTINRYKWSRRGRCPTKIDQPFNNSKGKAKDRHSSYKCLSTAAVPTSRTYWTFLMRTIQSAHQASSNIQTTQQTTCQWTLSKWLRTPPSSQSISQTSSIPRSRMTALASGTSPTTSSRPHSSSTSMWCRLQTRGASWKRKSHCPRAPQLQARRPRQVALRLSRKGKCPRARMRCSRSS